MAAWVQNQLDGANHNTNSVLTTTTFNFLNTFTSHNGLGGMVLFFEAGAGGGGNPPTSVSGVADNLGNNYTILDTFSESATLFGVTFALANVPGSPSTMTVTFAGASGLGVSWDVWCWADEVSGVSAIDKHTAQWDNTSGSTITSGSVTTTGADLVLGLGTPDGGTLTAGSGFMLRLDDTTNGLYSESLVQSTAGSTAAVFNLSPNGTGISGVIAFSPASTFTPKPPQLRTYSLSANIKH